MTDNQHVTEKQNNKSNDEIDLIELALKIWAERRIIYKTVAVFIALGLLVAFGSKKEYKSETSFILEDNRGGSRMSGVLSQFGGLAGINVNPGEAEGVISPQLFSNVVKSTPFMLELLYSEIKIEKFDTTTTVFNYLNKLEKPSLIGYLKGYTVGLPGKLIKLIQDNENSVKTDTNFNKKYKDSQEILSLSTKEESTINNLNNRIHIELDNQTGIINLSVQLPDAIAAAQLTRMIYEKLMVYLINYKIDKAKIDYSFIQDRYTEAQQNYIKAQKKLAQFRDQNRNMNSAYYKTEEERLQNEYQLAYDVYNGLAQQLERKKIEVQENTPVFKVVNNVKVPNNKHKPKTTMILTFTIFLGGFMGIFIIMLQMIVRRIKQSRRK